MTSEPRTREGARQRLRATRQALFGSIAGLSTNELQTIRATPEWSIATLLHHLLGWHELTVRAIEDWTGPRNWTPPIALTSEEGFNVQFLAERAGDDIEAILSGIATIYDRYAALLEQCTAAELDDLGDTPWGVNTTRVRVFFAITNHDLEHIEHIRAARTAHAG